VGFNSGFKGLISFNRSCIETRTIIPRKKPRDSLRCRYSWHLGVSQVRNRSDWGTSSSEIYEPDSWFDPVDELLDVQWWDMDLLKSGGIPWENCGRNRTLLLVYCSFRASWYIKSLVTPTYAQFYSLCILSIKQLLRVSALSPSSGSLRQNFITTYYNT